MQLRHYQERAADRLYGYDATILNAPMGAGKTAATLTALQDLLRRGEASRVLILSTLRICESVWPAEAQRWAPGLDVAVAVGSPQHRRAALCSTAPIVCLNFENVTWAAKEGLLRGFDVLVIDELTKLKDPSTKRWKALRNARDRFNIRMGLTGTLAGQGLLSLYGQVAILDDRFGRSFYTWRSRYFLPADPNGWKWKPQPGAEAALFAQLEGLVHTVDPGEYASELPELVTNKVWINMPRAAEALYHELSDTLVLALDDDTVVADSPGVLANKLRQIAAGFIYREDGTTEYLHPRKFDEAADMLEQLPNTLVLYQYKAELEAMQARVPGATIDSPGVVDAWNRGEIPVLYGQPASIGHGLNLQHGGNHLLWLSLPWSWEQFHQARARLYRSGQRETVFEHLLLMRATKDEDVLAALARGDSYSARLMTAVA